MITREQEPVPIEETEAARRMAGDRDDPKLRSIGNCIDTLHDVLRLRHSMNIRPVNDASAPNRCAYLAASATIVFMGQKDVRDSSHLIEGLDQRFEISRRIDQPVASGCRTKKLFAPKDFSELKPQ